jgi:hypothetical protein
LLDEIAVRADGLRQAEDAAVAGSNAGPDPVGDDIAVNAAPRRPSMAATRAVITGIAGVMRRLLRVRVSPIRVVWFGIRHNSIAHHEVNAANKTAALNVGTGDLAVPPKDDVERSRERAMRRLKTTGNSPPPRPCGSWLAGMVIGAAIITMAAQAMMLGAGAAIKNATLKGD